MNDDNDKISQIVAAALAHSERMRELLQQVAKSPLLEPDRKKRIAAIRKSAKLKKNK